MRSRSGSHGYEVLGLDGPGFGRFEQAVPHADVRWVDGATHGIVDTIGPGLGDELAAWLETA